MLVVLITDHCLMPISPTAEGFRAAFRRPLFTFAEITWRWVIGTTATVLLIFGFFEFLDTLPVTNGELFFLRSGYPLLAWQAIVHILRGGMDRAVLSLLVAALLLSVLWIVAASLGRIATVEGMIEYFRMRFRDALTSEADEGDIASNVSTGDRFGTMLSLNFLRVSVVLAGLIGFFGAALLAASSSSPAHPRPFLAFLIFVPLAGLVCLIGYELNWLLSLAAVFAVRDGEHAVDAFCSAVALCRERAAAVAAVSTWTGLGHLGAFFGASTVVSLPLGLARVLPWRLVALGVALVTLAYFAVSDWFYTARLAGYVCIAEMPDVLPEPPPPPITPPAPTEAIIDRDELILSDVPGTVVEA